MAMVIPRMPDRSDAHGTRIVGLFPHLVAVTGTGAGFQRQFEGSRRFATFLQQSAAVGIEMGVALDRLWGELQQEVGETDDGVLSVAAADLPGPPRTGLPRGSPDQDVVFAKLQRELTREREAVRGEAVAARYALLPQDDPARMAYKARGSTTALITLPNKLNCRSPRELVGDFVSLFGTADPELLDHEGKSFMDRGARRVVDVHGHSLSLYTGTGTRRHTAHDNIVRKLESILKFAGQNDIVAEDADVFKWCICNEARRERHVKAMGARGTRRDAHGIRPDLSALRSAVAVSDAYPFV